jgi:hypothetical protein
MDCREELGDVRSRDRKVVDLAIGTRVVVSNPSRALKSPGVPHSSVRHPGRRHAVERAAFAGSLDHGLKSFSLDARRRANPVKIIWIRIIVPGVDVDMSIGHDDPKVPVEVVAPPDQLDRLESVIDPIAKGERVELPPVIGNAKICRVQHTNADAARP